MQLKWRDMLIDAGAHFTRYNEEPVYAPDGVELLGTRIELTALALPEAEQCRHLPIRSGDVVAVEFEAGNKIAAENAGRSAERLREILKEQGVEPVFMLHPSDVTVECVRIEEARQQARQEGIQQERQRLLARVEEVIASWSKPSTGSGWSEEACQAVRSAFYVFKCCLTHAGVTREQAIAEARQPDAPPEVAP